MGDAQIVQLTNEDIEELKKGNHTAFTTLFKALFHHIRFFCERIVKDDVEAEDIAIHCFSKYWERAEKFNTLNEIRAFLFVTARNASFDYLDKEKAKRNYRQYASQTMMRQEATQFGYEAVMFEELFAQVVKEVENLPEQCKNVFKLVVFEQVSSEEVAKQLDISPGTVRMHCSVAIRKLRKVFSEQYPHLFSLFVLLFDYSKN
jgi:RNA polymerase sigma-70 factor (family 1)